VPDVAKLLEHAAALRALARRLAASDEQADDLVQETWIIALQHLPRAFEDPGRWLSSVLRNRHRENIRGERRRRGREEAYARRRESSHAPSDLSERAELLRRVVGLVLGLDGKYRDVVLLRFFEGLSVKEIGAREGQSVETVKTRLRRALETIRAQLDDEHGGDRSAWKAVLAPLAFASESGAASKTDAESAVGATKGVSLPWIVSQKTLVIVGALLMNAKKAAVAALVAAPFVAAGWIV
jgi:RNA polymerase sigma-70 factor (ECF subfamily)